MKIIFSLIIALILISGGFFYFLKETGVLSDNPFLASLAEFFPFKKEQKENFSLFEEEFSVLTQKIAFLEKQFKEKEKKIKKLDDLIEKFDLLSQKIKELETKSRDFNQIGFNIETEKLIEEVKSEKSEKEELKEKKEIKKKGLKREKSEKKEKKKKQEKIEETCRLNSIDLNTASLSELEKIAEVGPIIAQKIITSRPFYSLNDLLKVKGIDERTLEKIISQGCVYITSFASARVDGSGTSADSPKPTINLFYSSENPINKDIEVNFYTINLKNSVYDLKISILKVSDENEQKRTISEIYNQNENKWQSSYNYLKNVFSGDSFSRNFKLKIKDQNFRGQAEILAKIRESGKNNVYLEYNGKINIVGPKQTQNQPPIAKFIYTPINPIVGQEIIFDASSSTDLDGTVTNYIWDFGDRNSTTTNTPVISKSYSTSSDFLTTLLVVDNFGATNTAIASISISPPRPAVDLLLNPGFEIGTKANWIDIGTARRQIVADNYARTGIYSLKFESMTIDYTGRDIRSDPVSVTTGNDYSFGAWFYIPVGSPGNPNEIKVFIQILWFDDDMNPKGTYPLTGEKLIEPYGTWEKRELNTIAPEGATKAQLRISAKRETDATTRDLYIDDAFLF